LGHASRTPAQNPNAVTSRDDWWAHPETAKVA
jgi:hypothetical protein